MKGVNFCSTYYLALSGIEFMSLNVSMSPSVTLKTKQCNHPGLWSVFRCFFS